MENTLKGQGSKLISLDLGLPAADLLAVGFPHFNKIAFHHYKRPVIFLAFSGYTKMMYAKPEG